jgi:hypothetical protein
LAATAVGKEKNSLSTLKITIDTQPLRRKMWSNVVESGEKRLDRGVSGPK